MRHRKPRVLLIQDEPLEVHLTAEAAAEIAENPSARLWLKDCELRLADHPEEALRRLQEEEFDAVLLDLDAGGGNGAAVCRAIAVLEPSPPVVLLSNSEGQALALTLIRDGAQECLLKSELDCLPLARALRCAMERHRAMEACKSKSLVDDLTGLYSLRGFLHLAERHWALAERLKLPLWLSVVDVNIHGCEHQARDLRLIQFAEHLQARSSAADLTARIGPARFAWLRLESEGQAGGWPDYAAAVALTCPAGDRKSMGSMEEFLASAEAMLCENEAFSTPA
jgi:PleD family two-component response regulator